MTDRRRQEEGGQQELPAPSPSARVDLEAALLASEPMIEAAEPDPKASVRRRARIIMVLSPDPDSRYYIGECLRARPEVRTVEAGSVAIAEVLAIHLHPDLLIVDAPVTGSLARLPTIVLIDDRPPEPEKAVGGDEPARAWLARPFNAESLVTLVDRMLRRMDQGSASA